MRATILRISPGPRHDGGDRDDGTRVVVKGVPFALCRPGVCAHCERLRRIDRYAPLRRVWRRATR